MKKNLTVIGTGYVGLVTGACLAELGNKVVCVDIDEEKIGKLKRGIVPFYEPRLDELVAKNIKNGRLFFETDLAQTIQQSEIFFIAVGTPPMENGSADLSYVEKAVEDIAKNLKKYAVVVVKSTVPPGTCRRIKKLAAKHCASSFDLVSNPEFLREGSAVMDFMKPDRIVLGAESGKARKIMKELYQPLKVPLLITRLESSEMIKYASNAFLATKISFINEIANVCELVGADVQEIAKGMGLDPRIGNKFLEAGLGYGGSCFPKDVQALHQSAGINGYNFCLLKAVIEVNNNQRKLAVKKTEKILGGLKNKVVSIWGLAFKANTDDIRESAAVEIIELFLGKGVKIKTYDPIASENAKKILPEEIIFCDNLYEAIQESDALFIATDWDEFKKADFAKMKKSLRTPIIIDGKNIYNPEEMRKIGFTYISIGR
ncbi:MAG: UDP-glucose/GDP-mannose dehydrogenase family protein [Patescibacteria group bacterium]|nr:UDP-glucose/GDP-mannose dehydrogenase family protein [Patescibacteria group bacterium]